MCLKFPKSIPTDVIGFNPSGDTTSLAISSADEQTSGLVMYVSLIQGEEGSEQLSTNF